MTDRGDDDYEYSPPSELPDGVQKEVLRKGAAEPWRKPKTGDEVTVHYVGTLEGGEQFDSSRDRGEPIKFTLGQGEVIRGWDLGIPTMAKGELARFVIQPEFAYGEAGQAPAIPPSAVLVFEVELIGWVSKDDLFGDAGCIKSLIQEGQETWVHPEKGGEINLSLKVVAQDGRVIQESPAFDYDVGSHSLGAPSRVVEKALLGMSKGERCELLCAKDYVFQDSDYGKVTIELELHDIYSTSDVSLLKDRTVIKKIVAEGEGHERPQDMFAVRLRVEAATDGLNPLPGFSGPKDVEFNCGAGEVCDALEGAAASMKRKERAVITCTAPWKVEDAKLGLGKVSSAKVFLTVEMLDFTKGRELWSLSDEDKVELAMMRKEVGGQLFRARRFELALAKYDKVVEAIGSHDSFKPELKQRAIEAKRLVELNRAACYLQIHNPTGALSSCNKVLKEDRNNVKALFRRAKAHHARGEHVEAQQDLERVLELDAANSEAKALMPHVKRARRDADKASKGTFAKMCEGLGRMGPGRLEQPEEEPRPREPEEPEQRPDVVQVTFKIEYKPSDGEVVHIVGEPEELGHWDTSKAVRMRKLPQPYVPPVGSGRAPPEYHHWEAVMELHQDLGRFEYQYVIKGPSGERQEEGSRHKCDLTGMGGSRVKCTDSWRHAGA